PQVQVRGGVPGQLGLPVDRARRGAGRGRGQRNGGGRPECCGYGEGAGASLAHGSSLLLLVSGPLTGVDRGDEFAVAGVAAELPEEGAAELLLVDVGHLSGDGLRGVVAPPVAATVRVRGAGDLAGEDRKSTRLNSSHVKISY